MVEQSLQVWDLTGRKLFQFEGHDAPVYSVCPHQKENIQVRYLEFIQHANLLVIFYIDKWMTISHVMPIIHEYSEQLVICRYSKIYKHQNILILM